jgi:phage shock protein PspC (stress-responsive transcriptional regulator)
MNKTVTINISGIIFHIEEDAYDSLSKYLSTIKGYFSKTDGGNEIMSDIEARIAELLQAKVNASKQVILMSDVEQVMNIMGKPEEFGGDQPKEENTDYQNSNTYGDEKLKRRLFRDPDEKAIGGVCSGLAAYFNIDIVWVRLAMFLLIFFGGLSLWVYFILWIVIPEAKTTADKLAMRGEEANVNSIFKSFQEEAEDLKNRGKRQYQDASRTVRNNFSYARNSAAGVLNAFFNVLGRLIGLFLIFIGGALLIAYLSSVLGISVLNSNNDLTHWRSVIFDSTTDYALGVFAFIIIIGIPVMMLIYAGVKLLFKVRYHNRWINLGLGILWVMGLIIGSYVTISTIKQFNESARLKETYVLHETGDTLVIKMNRGTALVKDMKFDNNDDIDTYLSKNHGGYFFGENNKHLSVIGYAGLNVTESNSDSIEMTVTRTSRGNGKMFANENARAIDYNYSQNKNVLTFDEIFTVAEDVKFRAQQVDIKIKLPKGKVIYFDKSTKYLLDDIDNTSNTWDGRMIGRRWKMTEKGLECIDCEGLNKRDTDEDNNRRSRRSKKDKVIINGEGIEVNGNETEIRINDDGIKISTPEKDIDLKNDRTSRKEK